MGPPLGHIGGIPVEELAATLGGVGVGAISASLIVRAGRLRSWLAAVRRTMSARCRRA